MNCSRARRGILLYAGADLPSKKARRLERHLRECSGCRSENKELKAALAGLRALAERDSLDWPEAEWKVLMAQVTAAKAEPRPVSAHGAIPRKAWAYGLALAIVLAGAVIIWRSFLSPPASPILAERLNPTTAQPCRSFQTQGTLPVSHPRDVPFQVRREKEEPDRATLAARQAAGKPAQDLLSLTLVSQETGLKVYWTFNRNFKWEEKKQ
jgi:hypothetical protein